MNYEVECKFRIDDAAGLAARLRELDAEFAAPLEQVDRYFAHPARDFAQTDEALRLRRVGPANYVTYKGPKIDAATKTRRELELPLPPGEAGAAQFSELFMALGFRPVAEVRKQRRLATMAWQGREVEVAWDDVEQVGQFLELETSAAEADMAAARTCILALAERLSPGPTERRSYLELLLAGVGT
jgi:adenylate cyclase class 2